MIFQMDITEIEAFLQQILAFVRTSFGVHIVILDKISKQKFSNITNKIQAFIRIFEIAIFLFVEWRICKFFIRIRAKFSRINSSQIIKRIWDNGKRAILWFLMQFLRNDFGTSGLFLTVGTRNEFRIWLIITVMARIFVSLLSTGRVKLSDIIEFSKLFWKLKSFIERKNQGKEKFSQKKICLF